MLQIRQEDTKLIWSHSTEQLIMEKEIRRDGERRSKYKLDAYHGHQTRH
jgi:hypothetical protein